MTATSDPKPKPPNRRRKAQVFDGSVSERPRTRADGSTYVVFRGQFYDPMNTTAKVERTFSSVSYGTPLKAQRAAEKWLAKQRDDWQNGKWINPSTPAPVDLGAITVAQVADEWAATWDLRPLGKKTQAGYRALLDGRVLPYWGKKRVGSIKRADVQAWVNELRKSAPNPGNNHKTRKGAKLHPTTVRRAYAVLQLTLRHAVRASYIESNPCNGEAIELPSTRRAGVKSVGMALTWDQLRELVNATPEQWRTPVALCILTGVRSSELWGLAVRDWDPEAGTITVRQTLAYILGEHVAAPAKTEASEAAVSVPESLHAALTAAATAPGVARKSGRRGQPRGYPAMVHTDEGVELQYVTDPDDNRRLLFTLPSGAPVSHNNFYRRVFRPTVAQLWPEGHKLSAMRFHDLRHSHAVNVLYDTDNPVLVQKRMRHSQLAITVNLYGRHADAARDALLAGRIDDAWSGTDELAAKRAEKAA